MQIHEAVFRLRGGAFPEYLNALLDEGRHAGERPGSLLNAQARIDEAIALLDSLAPDALDVNLNRLKDHSTRQLVYTLPTTIVSNYTPNYSIESRKIVMATIFDYGGGSYSNLHVYWSLGGEWVANP